MLAFRVGFCVSGNGRLARAAIANAAQLAIEPALLVADHKASAELEDFCSRHSTPMVRLAKTGRAEFDERLTKICIEANLDLLVLTFEWLVRPPLIRHYVGRIINVHPALLPAFPGMDSLSRSVNCGAKYVGASIHEVDEGVDTGPVIAQCVVGLRTGDTATAAGARMFNVLRLMFLQVVRWYVEGRVSRQEDGRLMVDGAIYGEFPVSPAVEHAFAD